MTLEEAHNYLDLRQKVSEDSQIIHEINYFFEYYKPKGKLFLAYDRLAYFGSENPALRLTVDQNIRSRKKDIDLSAGDYGEPLMKDKYYLMEIKVPGAMPIWLAEILSSLGIYPHSFSKYGNIYKKSLITGGVSIILGLAVSFIYMYTGTCSKNFAVSLALLPVLVQVVIMMVNGNLGTSVAVLGAFGLVRFRSIPGSSKEIYAKQNLAKVHS